jgi:Ca2+-binding EF-hand superfamily protein
MIERFQQADSNKDGRLTKAEANGKMPRLHANFEKVDSDGDGYVTQQDIESYMTTIAGQRR